jgi:UMF1 family MFS transporter
MSFESGDEERDSIARKLRYDGEDISPTTTRELNGWYAYPIAAEVFAVVAVGAYHIHPPRVPNTK